MKTDTTAAIAKVDVQLTEANAQLDKAKEQVKAAKERVAKLEELKVKLGNPEELLAFAIEQLMSDGKTTDTTGTASADSSDKKPRTRTVLTEEQKLTIKKEILAIHKSLKGEVGRGAVVGAYNAKHPENPIADSVCSKMIDELKKGKHLKWNGEKLGKSKHSFVKDL